MTVTCPTCRAVCGGDAGQLVFVTAPCPVCLEEKTPTVTAPCGHVCCIEDWCAIGGQDPSQQSQRPQVADRAGSAEQAGRLGDGRQQIDLTGLQQEAESERLARRAQQRAAPADDGFSLAEEILTAAAASIVPINDSQH